MKVRDIMQRSVVTAAPTDSILDLCRLMTDYDARAVVIISENGPVGLVTERHVIEHCVAKGLDAGTCTVADILGDGKHTQPVTTVSADTDTIAAALILAKQHSAWLVVMDSCRPIGLVSVSDLAKEARFFLNGLLDAMSARPESTKLAYRYTYRDSREASARTSAPFD